MRSTIEAFEDRLELAAETLASDRERPCLVVVRTEFLPGDAVMVATSLRGHSFQELDVILAGQGGSLLEAGHIIREIRARSRRVNVLIPTLVEGAASAFLMAADKVVMGRSGRIGALCHQRSTAHDVHPLSEPAVRMALLGPEACLQARRKELLDLCRLVEATTGHRGDKALERANEMLVEALSEGIKPVSREKLEWSKRALDGARNWGETLSAFYRPSVDSALRDSQVARLVAGLAPGIDRLSLGEVQHMGLPARAMNPTEARMLGWMDDVIGSCGAVGFFGLFEPSGAARETIAA